MKKRALVISYHFFPDRAVGAKRPSQLAKSLIAEGWQVDVITLKLTPAEEKRRNACIEFGNVKGVYQHPGIINPAWRALKRLKGVDSNGSHQPSASAETPEDAGATTMDAPSESLASRFKRLLFSLQAILSATKSWVALSLIYLVGRRLSGRKYDLILSSSPTDSSHFLGLIAKKLFSAPWVMDIRDPLNLWDETDPETRTRFRHKLENWLETTYYKNSGRIVVTSPSLADELKARNDVVSDKVETVYNGFDGAPVEKTLPAEGPLKAIFAGSLYFKRNPFPLFHALESLKQKERVSGEVIQFDFYGDCDNWNGYDLKQWTEDHDIADIVCFKGSLPPAELESLLPEYHFFINFAQEQPKQIPAKTFDYLRFPGQMIVITEETSDTGTLIRDNGLGISVIPEPEEIEKVIVQVCDRSLDCSDDDDMENDVQDHRLFFSRQSQNQRYLEVMSEAVGYAKS